MFSVQTLPLNLVFWLPSYPVDAVTKSQPTQNQIEIIHIVVAIRQAHDEWIRKVWKHFGSQLIQMAYGGTNDAVALVRVLILLKERCRATSHHQNYVGKGRKGKMKKTCWVLVFDSLAMIGCDCFFDLHCIPRCLSMNMSPHEEWPVFRLAEARQNGQPRHWSSHLAKSQSPPSTGDSEKNSSTF